MVFRTNAIPVSRTQPLTSQSGNALQWNCWLTLWCKKKQIITLIFGFEGRGKSMLMAKKRTLDFPEGNISNWLKKNQWISVGQSPLTIKVDWEPDGSVQAHSYCKTWFFEASYFDFESVTLVLGKDYFCPSNKMKWLCIRDTFHKTIVMRPWLKNQSQLSGSFFWRPCWPIIEGQQKDIA